MDHAEQRLIGRALRRGWVIPDELKQQIVEKTTEIITAEKARPRDVNQAVRNIIAMESQNIALDPPVQKNVNVNLSDTQVDELIQRELDAIQALEAEAASGTEEDAGEAAASDAAQDLCASSVGSDRAEH